MRKMASYRHAYRVIRRREPPAHGTPQQSQPAQVRNLAGSGPQLACERWREGPPGALDAGSWEQRQRFRWEQAVRTRCRCINVAPQLRLTLCTRTPARFSQYLRKMPIGCWNKLVPPIDQLWEPIDPEYLCFLFSLQYLCFSNTFVFGYFSNPQCLIPGIQT